MDNRPISIVMDHENKNSWWLNEEFWDSFAPLMFDPLRWQNATTEVNNIIELVSPAPSSRILDAGCGPGRHALELASRNFQVTGIDLQTQYLETARSRIKETMVKPEFLRADLRDYSPGAIFDGAISMFQSIGYTNDPDDDLKICRNICQSLKTGGWLLLESDGKEAVASSFEERTWLERDGRTILLEYEVEGAWSSLRNHWKFQDRDGSWHECDFSYRLYSAVELGQLLEQAGFSSIEFFGGMDGRPYDHNAINLVALARRP